MSRRHLENLIFYVNELDDDVHCNCTWQGGAVLIEPRK